VPADLFDAVIEFKNLFVRRPDIEMKLRAAAARPALAHDLDIQIAKISARLRHLGDALNLPGDLINVVLGAKMFGVVAGVLPFVEFLFVEQRKGMVIAGVPAEETGARGLGDKKA